MRRHIDDRLAVEEHLAVRRRVETGQHVEERGLARAVRTDQGDDRTLGDLEVDIADCGETTELNGDATSVEQRRHDSTACAASISLSAWLTCLVLAAGMKPCGRNSIMTTRTIPKKANSYFFRLTPSLSLIHTSPV